MKIVLNPVLLLFAFSMLFACQSSSKRTTESSEMRSVLNLNGASVPIDSLETFIEHKMQEMQVPGLSFAIINDGQLAYHMVKGYSDLGNGLKVDVNTLFEGASTSKSMFAFLIMFLVEEGKLDLDKPLFQYLKPDLPGIYNYDERYEKVTARMVLAHMTGFPNWRGNGELSIGFEPGTNFSYSGEGYQFLVRAAESILETDYQGLEEYFQTKVARPLGMKHTRFVQDEYNIEHTALPHSKGLPMPKNRWEAKEFNAASAVHSEAAEFSKWIIAMMEGAGLSSDSYAQLFADQITVEEAPSMLPEEGAIAWTLGFAKYKLANQIVLGHEGNNDGFNCLFLFDRDKKWAMIQFNNANEVYDFGFDVFKHINSY